MQKGDQDAPSAGPDRVAERDRAAVGIDAVLRKPELSAHGERLRREGFVELEEINVLDAEPDLRERLARRGDRAYPHDAGLDSDRCVALDDSERLQAALLGHAL